MQTVERDSVSSRLWCMYMMYAYVYEYRYTLELCKQVQYYRSSRNQQVEEEYSTVQYSTVQYNSNT